MQFSAQQIQGGGQYGPKTKTGNWFEDLLTQECKYAEFRNKKDSGKLLINLRAKRMKTCCAPVALSYTEDGTVKYGNSITFYNDYAKACLACDPFEETMPRSELYVVSGSPSIEPNARNAFVITKLEKPDLVDPLAPPTTDTLHYNEDFLITVNPFISVDEQTGLLRPPLYLASTLKTDRNLTKWSNRQYVYLTETLDYNCVWNVKMPTKGKFDGVQSRFGDAVPVKTKAECCIVHKATKMPLAIDTAYGECTDFGGEYEISCHAFAGVGKNEIIVSEANGVAVPGSILKKELSQNIWTIVNSETPEEAESPNPPLPPKMTVDSLLNIFRRSLYAGGANYTSFRLKFPKNVSKVDIEDVKYAVKDFDSPLSDQTIKIMLSGLQVSNTDTMLSLSKVMAFFRGEEFGGERLDIVMKAYCEVVEKCTSFEQILSSYQFKHHPRVVGGASTEESIRDEFKTSMHNFLSYRPKNSLPVVSKSDFVEYYADVSAEVADTEGFIECIARSWGLL